LPHGFLNTKELQTMKGKRIRTCMNQRDNLGEIGRGEEEERAPAGRKWRLSEEEERR
jgi:hypothetical protein